MISSNQTASNEILIFSCGTVNKEGSPHKGEHFISFLRKDKNGSWFFNKDKSFNHFLFIDDATFNYVAKALDDNPDHILIDTLG